MRYIIVLFLFFLSAGPMFGVDHAENDTLLRVLQEELAADFDELQQQDVKPYFMSFRVQETYKANIAASYGYLSTSRQEHSRLFTPQIRVGSPELDNFKFNPQSSNGTTSIPLTDASPDAIRVTIWQQMLNAYERATSAYRNVQNRLRTQADNEDKAPCFSMKPQGEAATYYEEPLEHPALSPDEQGEWEQRLCRISAAFRSHPQFSEAVASLQMENIRTHLVNTEGTAIVQNRRSYRVFVQAETRTDDGMVLPLYQSYYATQLDSLPDESVMLRDAENMGLRLEILAQAPVADPFTGPALMSGEASGVFFHEIFGHRLEGHRMKSGGQTFRKMVGERVLPTDFQVYCDPTLTHYGSQPLNGGYVYDDEGTRARRVNNVVDGVLKEFLMNRVPLDSFPESNGHGRTAGSSAPVSRQSNLVVETRKPHTEAQLRQFLRDEARRQGKEYGYLFQSVSGGYTQTGEGGSINAFNVTPLEVYRIYVDGRPDELVRGVDLIGTPLSMFSNIEAGGDTPSTFIGFCGAESGWVPVSATSPMLFCSKIETQRRQKKGALMPVLSPPVLSKPLSNSPRGGEDSLSSDIATKTTRGYEALPPTGGDGEGLVFRPLQDELRRSMDSLRIDGQPAPFIIDYRLQRSRSLKLTAILGETITKELQPWGQKFDAEVIVGDYHHTSLNEAESNLRGSNIPMAVDYDNLRRQAWLATDLRYKQAIARLESKQQALKKVTLPADEARLDDLIPAQPATSIQQRSPESEDLRVDELEAYLRRLSLVAREFPELTFSLARINLSQTDIFRLTSEGVQVAQPQGDQCEIDFTFFLYRSPNGSNTNSTHNHVYANVAELLADSARFTRTLREYIPSRLQALKDTVIQDDYYVGPVLFEAKASQRIYNAANTNRHLFRAWHPYNESDRAIFAKFKRKMIDDKLTIRQDPTLKTWEGKPLVGYYEVDANGQKPQPVTLVERGIFCGQLCGSTPSLCTGTPTGNLRFNDPNVWNGPMGISTTPGVVRIESSKTMPFKKMRRELLHEAAREGYDHAYIAKPNGFLYRVNIKDGSETLVPLSVSSLSIPNLRLRHITALSTEQEAVTMKEPGSARFSVVGPKAMLLSDIEVPAATPEQHAKLSLTFPLNRK